MSSWENNNTVVTSNLPKWQHCKMIMTTGSFWMKKVVILWIGSAEGQMKSECIYEIIDFPKYHLTNLINICPGWLFRLDMLCTHLSRVALRIIKTNHMYLVYKIFQGRNLSNFFGGILENQWSTFWYYLTFSNNNFFPPVWIEYHSTAKWSKLR